MSRHSGHCKREPSQNELPITTNTWIDSDPRVGIYTNVIRHSNPITAAKLARDDASTPGYACSSQPGQQLFSGRRIYASRSSRFAPIQQLRPVCHG